MKLSCMQENLEKGLDIVGRATSARGSLPITANILLRTLDGRLQLIATNLEIAISCSVGAKVTEEGATTVPGHLFSEFVDSLPQDAVVIEAEAKDAKAKRSPSLKVTCGRSKGNISTIDADDFPPIPQCGQELVKLDPEMLRDAIQKVAFAASDDSSRPILTAVALEMKDNQVNLVAADGFRLAIFAAELETNVSKDITLLLPQRSLQELGRLLAKQQDPVVVSANEKSSAVKFALSDAELTSQLIQGTFPNYRQLIPTTHTTRTVVDVQQMLSAVRQAAIFAQDGSGIVRFQMAQGKMIISARAEELGDNVSEVDAVVEGEDAKVALNARYVLQLLSALKDGQVEMLTSSPSTPVMFKSIGGNEHETHEYVIMPMFVQW